MLVLSLSEISMMEIGVMHMYEVLKGEMHSGYRKSDSYIERQKLLLKIYPAIQAKRATNYFLCHFPHRSTDRLLGRQRRIKNVGDTNCSGSSDANYASIGYLALPVELVAWT